MYLFDTPLATRYENFFSKGEIHFFGRNKAGDFMPGGTERSEGERGIKLKAE